jgi:hypothetical protein
VKRKGMDAAVFWLVIIGPILIGLAGCIWYGGSKTVGVWSGFAGAVLLLLAAALQLQQFVSKSSPSSPFNITLESLFKNDFGDLLSGQREFSLTVKDNTKDINTTIKIPIKMFEDFRSNTEFISVFIPQFSDTRLGDKIGQVIRAIGDEVPAIRQIFRGVVVGQKVPGGGYTESTTLVFSGRVFIYTMNPLSAVQIGDLVKWYAEKGMDLEIRGTDYWLFHNQK